MVKPADGAVPMKTAFVRHNQQKKMSHKNNCFGSELSSPNQFSYKFSI